MIHETHTDTGKWLELDPGVQRTIAIRTWFFDCRLIVNNNNNNTGGIETATEDEQSRVVKLILNNCS